MVRNKTDVLHPIRLLTLLMALMTLALSLSGCLTAEEKLALAEFGTTATTYYKDKYGDDPRIESCGYYIDGSGLFPQRTERMYARCASGDFIFYDAARNQIVDNHQSDEISAAIEAEFAKQIESVEAFIKGSEIVIRDFGSTAYAGSYEGNFYHSYYDGDITTFLEAEDVQLTANLYLLCDENDQWREAQKKCEEIIRTNFRTEQDVTLTVLSRECFDEKQGEHGIYAGLDDLGCYAKFHMTGTTTDSYIQNYIKVADGIYVTCCEANFAFEAGDVTAVSSISEDELNAKIYARYDQLPDVAEENAGGSYVVHDKTRETYSVATATSPIYQLQFSERVKESFPDGEVTVYLLFVAEEVGAAEGEKVLRYADVEKSYRCGAFVQANGGEAGWGTINENDYYFIGASTVMGPEKENKNGQI